MYAVGNVPPKRSFPAVVVLFSNSNVPAFKANSVERMSRPLPSENILLFVSWTKPNSPLPAKYTPLVVLSAEFGPKLAPILISPLLLVGFNWKVVPPCKLLLLIAKLPICPELAFTIPDIETAEAVICPLEPFSIRDGVAVVTDIELPIPPCAVHL